MLASGSGFIYLEWILSFHTGASIKTKIGSKHQPLRYQSGSKNQLLSILQIERSYGSVNIQVTLARGSGFIFLEWILNFLTGTSI